MDCLLYTSRKNTLYNHGTSQNAGKPRKQQSDNRQAGIFQCMLPDHSFLTASLGSRGTDIILIHSI